MDPIIKGTVAYPFLQLGFLGKAPAEADGKVKNGVLPPLIKRIS
jgi:hypothetical protein